MFFYTELSEGRCLAGRRITWASQVSKPHSNSGCTVGTCKVHQWRIMLNAGILYIPSVLPPLSVIHEHTSVEEIVDVMVENIDWPLGSGYSDQSEFFVV